MWCYCFVNWTICCFSKHVFCFQRNLCLWKRIYLKFIYKKFLLNVMLEFWIEKKMAMTFVFSFRLNQSHWKFEIKWKCELKMLQIMGKVSSQYVICDGYSSRGHLLLVVSSGCDGNVVRYGFSARNCEHSTIVGVVLLWTFFCLQCPVGLQERLVVSCCFITHPS